MIFFLTVIAIDENPTRQKIVMLLNKVEHMTVSELSRAMGITPMAVRQHLMYLEKKRIISYVAKKYGIGRPVFLYSLTEQARDIFPSGYLEFTRNILRTIEKMDGRKKVDSIFKLRKDSKFNDKATALSGIKDIGGKVARLAGMLDEEGYMVETEEGSEAYYLKEYNCPLFGISNEYPEACKYELELYRDLLVAGVERSQCQKDGAPSCTYVIPKA
jgi:predicted ArsR family transcriptional regulator